MAHGGRPFIASPASGVGGLAVISRFAERRGHWATYSSDIDMLLAFWVLV